MATRYFALILGIIYALVGILGFIPAAIEAPPAHAPQHIAVDSLYGYLLGLFPVNIVHSLIHLAVGIWGIYAYRSFVNSRTYARALAIIFGVLAVMGLIPLLSTTFGLAPLFGHDVWLHAITALAAAYFGWVAAEERIVTVR